MIFSGMAASDWLSRRWDTTSRCCARVAIRASSGRAVRRAREREDPSASPPSTASPRPKPTASDPLLSLDARRLASDSRRRRLLPLAAASDSEDARRDGDAGRPRGGLDDRRAPPHAPRRSRRAAPFPRPLAPPPRARVARGPPRVRPRRIPHLRGDERDGRAREPRRDRRRAPRPRRVRSLHPGVRRQRGGRRGVRAQLRPSPRRRRRRRHRRSRIRAGGGGRAPHRRRRHRLPARPIRTRTHDIRVMVARGETPHVLGRPRAPRGGGGDVPSLVRMRQRASARLPRGGRVPRHRVAQPEQRRVGRRHGRGCKSRGG